MNTLDIPVDEVVGVDVVEVEVLVVVESPELVLICENQNIMQTQFELNVSYLSNRFAKRYFN